MVTPHTAGVTREARVNMGRIAAEQMLAALDGRPVARVLNPEVWPRYAARFKETFGITPEGPSCRAVKRDSGPAQHRDQSLVGGREHVARRSSRRVRRSWITVVALKPIAAETGGARSVPAFASSLAWFGAGSAASAWASSPIATACAGP